MPNMSEGMPYADIIIMALIAGFILLRLRSVLGDKTGNNEPSYFNRPSKTAEQKQQTVVQLDEMLKKKSLRAESEPLAANLPDAKSKKAVKEMKEKDSEFTLDSFMQGSKGAYEMVFDAFAKGDRKTLEFLLSDDVYQEFESAIAAREEAENNLETTLISVDTKGITNVDLDGTIARISVTFISEQVSVTRNDEGDVVDGDPSAIIEVNDEWTFERDMTSRNPNWKVIET